jgi:Mce-associated membrane protein
MTDETTPPQPPSDSQPERSWAPETGWPAPANRPAWAELPDEASSNEDEYDAWLDAQDPPAEDQPAEASVVEAPAAPEAHDAAPEPAEGTADVGLLEQEALEELALPDEPAELQTPAPWTSAPDTVEEPDEAELEADVAAEPELDAETELDAEADVAVDVDAPVVVPDPIEAAATPLAIAEPAAEPDPEPVDEAPVLAEQPLVDDLPAQPGGDVDEGAAAPASRSGTVLVAPLAVLVVLLVAVTAVLGVWSSRTSGGGAVEDARRDALSAARAASRVLFSYDYRHLDKDFAAGKAVTTGTFASDYEKTTSKIVNDVAPRYKAVVVADVSDAAVVSATAARVQVLVFVNQRSTSSLAAGQKITQSRLTMTLERKHGTWLVSKVSAF